MAELDAWFGASNNNIAIVTGPGFGAVLDIDPAKGGRESLHGRDLGKTLSARTGGGGEHHVYEYPGWEVADAQTIAGLAGVDIRGGGGYIIGPPSVHPNGTHYEWLPGLGPDVSSHNHSPNGWLSCSLSERQQQARPGRPGGTFQTRGHYHLSS